MLHLPPFDQYHRPTAPIRLRNTAMSAGLRHCWPLIAGVGTHDIAAGGAATINPTSTLAFQPHPDLGLALYLASGGGTASMLTTSRADLSAPWTFHFWWHRIAGPSTVHVVTSKPGVTTGVRGEQFNNTKALGYTSGGSDRSSGLIVPTSRAVPVTYVQRNDAVSTGLIVYLDQYGLSKASATIPSAGSVLTLSRIGNYADAVSLPIYGWYGHICVWDRALTEAEVLTLHHPLTRWDLYEPARSFWWPRVAGGAPPAGGRYNYTTLLGIR